MSYFIATIIGFGMGIIFIRFVMWKFKLILVTKTDQYEKEELI